MFLAYVPEEAGTASNTNQEYLDQIRKVYVVEQDSVEKLDWFLILAGSIGTILSVIAIVGWILYFFTFLFRCSIGKSSIRDIGFWKRMIGSFLVIVLFTTGVIFAFGEEMYNLLLEWGKL
ncbi:hypothetical protein [Mycobacterium tuberculosis]|uniref:hypothetical protein n=1 Tax=Mycobacterium tuberculosis TaxID=1773 RepID=UPI001115254B|nr:hypothetical protein [Mycobacterium tuberculosis]